MSKRGIWKHLLQRKWNGISKKWKKFKVKLQSTFLEKHCVVWCGFTKWLYELHYLVFHQHGFYGIYMHTHTNTYNANKVMGHCLAKSCDWIIYQDNWLFLLKSYFFWHSCHQKRQCIFYDNWIIALMLNNNVALFICAFHC